MNKYRIISDGSCDLPAELAKERGVSVVPFYVTMDEKTYLKEGIDILQDDFYEWMVTNPDKFPKSAMPSPQDFLDAFTDAAKAGEDIICMCITRKFSSSYQTAMTAKEMLNDVYPDIKVTVIDCIVNTVLQGQLVLEACNLRDAGASYDEVIAQIEEIKPTARIFFTVGNLDYLKHGGRIGKLAGIAGSLLGIRPIITLKEGEIFSSGIVRSRSKSLDKVEALVTDYIKANFTAPEDYSLAIGYGYDYDESVKFREKITNALQNIGHKVTIPIYHIGATISVHTGPYPLGVGIVKRGKLCKA